MENLNMIKKGKAEEWLEEQDRKRRFHIYSQPIAIIKTHF
jgi:hypothetical protein